MFFFNIISNYKEIRTVSKPVVLEENFPKCEIFY